MIQINTKYNTVGGDTTVQLQQQQQQQQQPYQRGSGGQYGASGKYSHPRGAPDVSLIFGTNTTSTKLVMVDLTNRKMISYREITNLLFFSSLQKVLRDAPIRAKRANKTRTSQVSLKPESS
jgi:hypothetical protein